MLKKPVLNRIFKKLRPNDILKKKGVVKKFTKEIIKTPAVFILNGQKRSSEIQPVSINFFQKEKKNIRFLKKINSLRGYRHKVFLPTRGQNTKTNGKTQKKKRNRQNFNLKQKNKKSAVKKK